MAGLCEKLNKKSLTTVHYTKLNEGDSFVINTVEKKETKQYGTMLLCIIEDMEKERKQLFLGQGYAKLFSEEDVSKINKGEIKIKITFKGIKKGTIPKFDGPIYQFETLED